MFRTEDIRSLFISLATNVEHFERVTAEGEVWCSRNLEGGIMKRIAFLLVAVATLAGGVAFIATASGHADGEATRSS